MTWVDWFFGISLVLFVWQLVRYWQLESDQEWYKKHPRSGVYTVPDGVDKISVRAQGGGMSDPPQPPDLSQHDIVLNIHRPGDRNGNKPR